MPRKVYDLDDADDQSELQEYRDSDYATVNPVNYDPSANELTADVEIDKTGAAVDTASLLNDADKGVGSIVRHFLGNR